MIKNTEVRAWENSTDWQHLLWLAAAEKRTEREIEEIEEAMRVTEFSDFSQWEDRLSSLRSRLARQQNETEARARRTQGEEMPHPATLTTLAREAAAQAYLTHAPSKKESSTQEVACPVAGCTGAQSALPIQPSLADLPYTCPCHQQHSLTVGRTKAGQWVLREWSPPKHAREEINRIMHALVTGQVVAEKKHGKELINNRADPVSSRLDSAGQAMVSHAMRCYRALLDGKVQHALEFAERAEAAATSYKHWKRTYNRQRRERIYSGRWHDSMRFWIEMPPLGERYYFEFLAVYDDVTGKLCVENGEEIELESGVRVGAAGWNELVELLERVDPAASSGKPGAVPDLRELIYRQSEGTWKLRPHLKRYSRVLLALEALRMTLRRDRRSEGEALPEGLVPQWVEAAQESTPRHEM